MAQSAIINLCDLCESETGVDYFCTNCEEKLCLNCKVIHSKSRKTRQDKLISLSQARHNDLVHQSTTVFCGEHSSVEITLVCLKCNQVVCMQCMSGKHKGHGVTIVDDIRDSKFEELKNIIKTLKEKKAVYENAFIIQSQAYERFLKSVDKVKGEITKQKTKIIEELNNVCDKQFAELLKLRQNEEKIYSDACNQIQIQTKAVASSLQIAENRLSTKNAVLIIQSTVAVAQTLQMIEEPSISLTTVVTYQPGDRSNPAICQIQGKVNIKHATVTYKESHPATTQVKSKIDTEQGAKPKLMADIHKVKLPEQKTNGDNKQRHEDNKPMIDRSKVRTKSTVKVKDKSFIYIIVPLQNKTAWVQADSDPYLTLINSRDKILTTSVPLDDEICDAKQYGNRLLVTCWWQFKIYSLSVNGRSVSTLSDLSPYNTRGLCVTKNGDVIVCLQSFKDNKDNKVVRLNTTGTIIQTIQHDLRGAPRYTNPYRVTVLTSGEIIVIDGNKTVGVNKEGTRLFTWDGEVQDKKLDKYSLRHITHDSNNNLFVTDWYNKVLLIGKNGSGAMCLLDRTQGIDRPCGVAVDNVLQLWVGCAGGNIHVIHTDYIGKDGSAAICFLDRTHRIHRQCRVAVDNIGQM